MQLSVIIVNYNVKFFLEQCLCSVAEALREVDGWEVFVVDNTSSDGSIAYLSEKFPWAKFIANARNVGFAKANNQALRLSKGAFVLFLNPDTIVPENGFAKCIGHFYATPRCGAIGVRMIDGGGRFLPESKRGFPSPAASFFKLSGLSSLFPRSRVFNYYALGHLDALSDQVVDVLAGAFMMLRGDFARRADGFDEAFFMYGEDIDLSYRVQKAGLENHYLASVAIIHFKGESTKKGSLNYVKMFYNAMIVFVDKHYPKAEARFFSWLVRAAIVGRAGLSVFSASVGRAFLPFLDALIVFGSIKAVETAWTIAFRNDVPFRLQYYPLGFAALTVAFLATSALAGLYDKPFRSAKPFTSGLSGIVAMVAVYGLFPDGMQFSRAVVLLGGLASVFCIYGIHSLMARSGRLGTLDEGYKFQQTVAVANVGEYEKMKAIYERSGLADRLLGRVAPKARQDTGNSIGQLSELKTLIAKLNIREIVFCQGELTYGSIIRLVQELPGNICFRFMGGASEAIVGSDDKTTTGEVIAVDGFYHLSEPYNQRMKRIFDIGLSLLLLSLAPFAAVPWGRKRRVVINCLSVLAGRRTWVGYVEASQGLPEIRPNVLTCYGLPKGSPHPLNKEAIHHLDQQYARNYEFWSDLRIVLANRRNLWG